VKKVSSSIPKPELIKAIQTASRTGQVVYGAREVTKLVLHGKAKLVILAANAPPEIKRDISYYAKLSKVPVLIFEGTNIELGNIIGRPHSIAVLAVIDPGQSRILELVTGE
jgi:large subunit ribosomal protein L30e